MRTIALQCNHCGAPLQVSEAARFVTCNHCGSQLAIHRDGDAAWTELSERVDRNHAELSRGLEVVQLQNELERLDREWGQTCDRFRIRTGKKSRLPDEPGAPNTMAGLSFAGALFAAGLAANSGTLLVAAVLAGAVVLFGGQAQAKQRERFGRLRLTHNRRRSELVRELNGLRSERDDA